MPIKLSDLKVKLFTDGADKAQILEMAAKPWIKGFTTNPSLLKKAGISLVRIYASGLNLITWDKMKIWDPESTSGNGQYYPQARIINLGARVTF